MKLMKKIRIALIGGGPSALFIIKKLLQHQPDKFTIDIFERQAALGRGMPYSHQGASFEHVTNVSSDELCPLTESLIDWVNKQPEALLAEFSVEKSTFHEKQVTPRLLFGLYLEDQFKVLLTECEKSGLHAQVHLHTDVLDIIPDDDNGQTSSVLLQSGKIDGFDITIICTGHVWPTTEERKTSGYYGSPYPPAKLNRKFNHPVALKGSSLTAIDAIRTLSVANGRYFTDSTGQLKYQVAEEVPDFKLVMHSLHGLLPNVRFHLDDPLVSTEGMLSEQRIDQHISHNGGFLSLDFIFEHNFKGILKHKDPTFYAKIADRSLESFVDWMLGSRKAFEPFTLFKLEYLQAGQSIEDEHSIKWMEVLSLLSFAVNHPAKYLCAEDMLRLHNVLQPLIALVIANVPQSSAEQLLALHAAGVLQVISVDSDSEVKIEADNVFNYVYKDSNNSPITQQYATFVDCTGQQHLPIEAFPFKSMLTEQLSLTAKLRFKTQKSAQTMLRQGATNVTQSTDGHYWLTVSGLAINDHYQLLLKDGQPCARYFIMAVPYISGFNPDYSGFDFCDQVSSLIVDKICEGLQPDAQSRNGRLFTNPKPPTIKKEQTRVNT